eukprot:5170655-Prymnesium_polylepis.1
MCAPAARPARGAAATAAAPRRPGSPRRHAARRTTGGLPRHSVRCTARPIRCSRGRAREGNTCGAESCCRTQFELRR